MGNRNLDLPDRVNDLLDVEKEAGASITSTLGAAVYWFFNRLDAHQRELARLECGEWLQTGKAPPAGIASEMELALHSARERGLRRLGRGKQADR